MNKKIKRDILGVSNPIPKRWTIQAKQYTTKTKKAKNKRTSKIK